MMWMMVICCAVPFLAVLLLGGGAAAVFGGGYGYALPIIAAALLAACALTMFRRHKHSAGGDHATHVMEADATDQKTGPAHQEAKSDHSCCH